MFKKVNLPNLATVTKIILTLSHGQAQVVRVFTINKETPDPGVKETHSRYN